jgi:kynurenine formamidase
VRVLDLTQPLDERTVLWPGSVPFAAIPEADGYDEHGFWAQSLRMPEHAGTHLDAPRHVVPGGPAVADIPAGDLVRPAVRIDARALCGGDPAWTLRAADVEAWEAEHGRVPAGAAVLLCTGWDAHRADPARYLGEPLAFPGYGAGAAELLVARGAAGLGIDTLGVDPGHAPESPVHHISLPAGLWHLEGLIGLDAVPATGATLVVGALTLPGASGTPARVLALLP